MSSNPHLGDRKFIIGGFFILVVIVYVCRLFYMQIIDESYADSARQNALQRLPEFALRGVIYDRNGKLLVTNEPSYDLIVTPKLVKGCDTMALCEILQITMEEFKKRIKRACQAPNSPRKQSVFEKQMSQQTYATLQEKLYRFNGFYPQARAVRKYPRPIAAHLLGYVGEVSKEKAALDSYYKEGDYIGVSGMEKSYESVLRGEKGVRKIVKDVHNKEIGRYMNGKYDTAAVAGEPLYSSIDVTLQEYGERLMRGKIGAIVAIEPSTGEILCMVSSPTYDPNLLVGGKERARNFLKLSLDSTKPLIPRAIQSMYPPGSTFKLIDALIAQNDGLINRNTSFPCHMGYPPGGGKPKCHAHGGAKNLIGSIAVSCNSYYSYVFREIVDQRKYPKFIDGYNHWRNTVMTFGPNRSLGTDLPFDKPGNVPSEKYYDKVFGKDHWRSNTIVSLGIGQAELLLVPLQMANVVAIIANKGYYYIPHCIKGVGRNKTLDSRFKEKHYVAVQKQEYYDNVIEGMHNCFEPGGTGIRSRIPGIAACGKTGTAQNPHGKDHSEFQAFAPMENPKIAIACLVENGGFGHEWAAPIASLLIEKYLTGKISTPARLAIEKKMLEGDLIHKKSVKSPDEIEE